MIMDSFLKPDKYKQGRSVAVVSSSSQFLNALPYLAFVTLLPYYAQSISAIILYNSITLLFPAIHLLFSISVPKCQSSTSLPLMEL